MRVTMRSDSIPDVVVENNSESCDVSKLEQHIRTLQISLRWLKREQRLRREREARIAERKKKEKAAQNKNETSTSTSVAP